MSAKVAGIKFLQIVSCDRPVILSPYQKQICHQITSKC